uniref:Receptor ligand binding region domain-containing protein n=1 Tax=Romanomermis culicivorax TaxID=13658 RepID=A0A915KC45_ROMCU
MAFSIDFIAVKASLQISVFYLQLYMHVAEALNRISIEKILPRGSLCMHYADSNASDTFGPWRAVEALAKNELDVVFGYANAYAMSPVARMSWLFKNGNGVPVITSIGQVDSLDDRTTYKLLTRMTGSYAELARSVHAFFKMMGWTKFAYLFHANVKLKQYGRTECSHQLGAIHTYQLDGSVQYSSALIKEFDPSFQTVNFLHLVRNASMMANIIILCGTPDAIRQILLAAYDSGMCQNGEYVFINIDISVK